MKVIKNILLQGKHKKPILVDLFYKESKQPKPILIFSHGYKGYKDWGAWNVMAEKFVKAGFFFIKFNFSHNGGTPEQPIDFPDLEAFGNNNFIKELDDLDTVIDWVFTYKEIEKEIDKKQVSLMGHSRGGGIVLIKAAEDCRITNVITLAGVSDYKVRFPVKKELEQWKHNQIAYVENVRTRQQMPHYFQFYTNFIENEERLTIQRAVKKLKIPYLIIQGSNDPTVDIKEAKQLHKWSSTSQLKIISDADHAFGSQHPWDKEYLPNHLEKAINDSILFLKN